MAIINKTKDRSFALALLKFSATVALSLLLWVIPAWAGVVPMAEAGEDVRVVENNGITFAVRYPQNIKCGEPTRFHFSVSGLDGTETAKYRINHLSTYDDCSKETVLVYDISHGSNSAYSETAYWDFTFYASGTYTIRFDAMARKTSDGTYTVLHSGNANTDIQLNISDSDYPSVQDIVEQTARDCLTYCNEQQALLGKNYSADYTKALYMNDYLVKNSKYDHSYSYCSAEGVLARGTGTCESYHRAYCMLLKAVGVNTGRMVGNGHVWTAVSMDGNWYQVDTTWNDDDYSCNYLDLNRLYMGITDDMMTKAHSDHRVNEGYESTHLEDNYFVRSGEIHKYSDCYLDSIRSQIADGKESFELTIQNTAWPAGYKDIVYPIVAFQLQNEDWGSGNALNARYEENNLYFTYEKASEDCGDVIAEDLPGTDEETLAERIVQIPEGLWVAKTDACVFSGKAIKPAVHVYFGKKRLTSKKQFSVKFAANKYPGTATVTVSGKKAYKGTATGNFTILPKDITAETEAIEDVILSYRPTKNQSLKYGIKVGKKKLARGKDYKVTITNQTTGEPCTVCRESAVYEYKIEGVESRGYTGGGIIRMTILPAGYVSMRDISVRKIGVKRKTGTPITLSDKELIVSYGKKNILTKNIDYTVEYITDPDLPGNNTNAGYAKVLLTGTGEKYVGTKTITFRIRK